MFALMETVVLLAEGRAGEAVELATQIDGQLSYNADGGEGILKLTVRMFKVEALAASGRTAEAHALLAEVEAINPEFPPAVAARAALGKG
jgi:hypothetical protein